VNCGVAAASSSNEETLFEKSLSLHICGLQFLLSFLLPERSELDK
jgi:hypothetical protein